MKNLVLFITTMFCITFFHAPLFSQCHPVGNGTNGGIYCLYPDSSRNCLYIGGGFHTSGNDSLHFCTYWNDTAYIPMGPTGYHGMNDSVWCYTMFGGDLYAGGNFTQAGSASCNHIARWDGTSWHPLGNGFNGPVRSLCVYNNELYAGGQFTASGSTLINHFGKWDGSNWMQVGGGVNDHVNAMAVCFGQLFLGGDFTKANGSTANHICSWDGSNFSTAVSGIEHHGMMGHHTSVYSLCVYNGMLYCGGSFDHAGGQAMHNLAMWNNSNWSSIGSIGNNSSRVTSMCVYNNTLYVGGMFTSCHTLSANNLGIWNGTEWSTISSGMNGIVQALSVYNDELYMAGSFTDAAGTPVNNIAKYSSTTGIQAVTETNNPLQVYPNPAREFVYINLNHSNVSPVSIRIYSISGKLMFESNTKKIQLDPQKVYVGDWNAGMYFCVSSNGQVNTQTKFTVTGGK